MKNMRTHVKTKPNVRKDTKATPRPNAKTWNEIVPGESMDASERRVLRRKRPILADTLTFTPEDQKEYRRLGLLDDKMVAEIMVETTDFGQMFKFLDLLAVRKGASLDVIVSIVEENGETWLADEIRVEMLLERGDLDVEEYVFREAGVIVHRQWGKSKRFSELDKKELQYLLALRYQAAKEAWSKQLSHSRQQLQQAEELHWHENRRMRELSDKVALFLRVQNKRINSAMHDLECPVDLIREDDPECKMRDYCEVLEQFIDQILEVMARVLLERENMQDERKRCFAVLNINKPVAQLDTVLDYALQRAAEDLVKTKREAELSDQMAGSLDATMKALKIQNERELAAKDKQILLAQNMARQKEERIQVLERLLSESISSLEDSQDEVERWKKKCNMLERTRRVGYYHPGWQDKLYGIDGIDYGVDSPDRPIEPKLLNKRTKHNMLSAKSMDSLMSLTSVTSKTTSTASWKRPVSVPGEDDDQRQQRLPRMKDKGSKQGPVFARRGQYAGKPPRSTEIEPIDKRAKQNKDITYSSSVNC